MIITDISNAVYTTIPQNLAVLLSITREDATFLEGFHCISKSMFEILILMIKNERVLNCVNGFEKIYKTILSDQFRIIIKLKNTFFNIYY